MVSGMDTQASHYQTQRIDHLGIVAGICRQIGLIEVIDESLPTPSGRKVSCGQATQAMVLNALGLTGRALYLMPEYFENKPVDLLVGEGLLAADFNDDTLGRALDELHQAGVTELFAAVAAQAVRIFGIENEYVHLDSSSFALHGQYDSHLAASAVERYGAVAVRHGYSREHRPDLKQVVVSLITSQASALPLWLEVLDGNSSDKESFRHTVQAYTRQLESGTTPWFVMDSAAYSAENLAAWQETGWVTRVPQTLADVKRIQQGVATDAMTEMSDGYRIFPLCSTYGDTRQRWLLVYSAQAHARESRQLDKQVARAADAAEKAWRGLCQTTFACEADAQAALEQLTQRLPWHHPAARVVALKKYARPGRPAKDAVAQIVGWQLHGHLVAQEAVIAGARQWLGRFVLATNVLEEERLSHASLLACYKEQSSSVERGFRFLKDPLFFADSLFLKSPARIMAMIMIMGLALLIYALAERLLRQQLKAHNETLPDQKGKATQSPTLRRVAQMFEGVDLLLIHVDDQLVSRQILNLTPVRRQILRLLGPEVENCYLVPT